MKPLYLQSWYNYTIPGVMIANHTFLDIILSSGTYTNAKNICTYDSNNIVTDLISIFAWDILLLLLIEEL